MYSRLGFGTEWSKGDHPFEAVYDRYDVPPKLLIPILHVIITDPSVSLPLSFVPFNSKIVSHWSIDRLQDSGEMLAFKVFAFLLRGHGSVSKGSAWLNVA